MLFFKERTVRAEPTKEQLDEERKFAERNRQAPKRTTSGETTQVVRMTNAAIDAAVKKSKSVRESAKTLHEQAAAARVLVDTIKK